MRTTAIATVLGVAAMALAPAASAEKLKLSGQVVGQPQSKAQITVIRDRHRNLQAVRKVQFKKVNALCDDGSSGTISGSDPRKFAVGGKNFTRKTRVLGTGIDHGYFKATGKFRQGGKAVKGNVRFAFKTTTGAGCGTGKLRWRAET